MATSLFYMPFVPVFTSRGLPAPAAQVFFYLSGTTTKAPIFSDDGVTPMLNPVEADAIGHIPSVYLNKDITYRVRLVDIHGAQIGEDIDPYFPGTALVGPPGGNVMSIPSFQSPGPEIDSGALLVRTSSYFASGGGGGAFYQRNDALVTPAYVAAYPRESFRRPDENGVMHGYLLDRGQTITPYMFGARGNPYAVISSSDTANYFAAFADETAELQAFFDFCGNVGQRIDGIDWGGTFAISGTLTIGGSGTINNDAFNRSINYRGALTLLVKAQPSDRLFAVIENNASRQTHFDTIAIQGGGGLDYSSRNFTVGILTRKRMSFGTFDSVFVAYARHSGIAHVTLGDGGNTAHNHYGNCYLYGCGSGAPNVANTFFTSFYLGAVNSGGSNSSSQYTTMDCPNLPPADIIDLFHSSLDTPFFAFIGFEEFKVVGLDRSTNKVMLSPWVPASKAPSGTLQFVYGGGFYGSGGDAGLISGKFAATACSIGLSDAALYPGGKEVTLQNNVIGLVLGAYPGAPLVGAEYDAYFEGNLIDVYWNASSLYYATINSEHALSLAKTRFFRPRTTTADNDFAFGSAPRGLAINYKGRRCVWRQSLGTEGAWDYGIAAFDRAPEEQSLRGTGATIDIAALADENGTTDADFARLFGYHHQTFKLSRIDPAAGTMNVTVRPGPGRKINGGAAGSNAVFAVAIGANRHAEMQVQRDRADATNYVVTTSGG